MNQTDTTSLKNPSVTTDVTGAVTDAVTANVTTFVTRKEEKKQKKEEFPPAPPIEEKKQKKERNNLTPAHACVKNPTEKLEFQGLRLLESLNPIAPKNLRCFNRIVNGLLDFASGAKTPPLSLCGQAQDLTLQGRGYALTAFQHSYFGSLYSKKTSNNCAKKKKSINLHNYGDVSPCRQKKKGLLRARYAEPHMLTMSILFIIKS